MRRTLKLWGLGRYVDDAEVVQWLDQLFGKADFDGDGSLSFKEVEWTAFLGDI